MVVRFLSTLAVLLLFANQAAAQLNPLGNTGGSDEPMELESDKGLELHQDRQIIVARGNVVVRQGKVRLRADIVSASYKDWLTGLFPTIPTMPHMLPALPLRLPGP